MKYFSTKTGIANFTLTSKVLGEKNWTLDVLKLRKADLIEAAENFWRLR
jgi:hypothetical protein